jgi:hypothetical protein
MKATETTKKTPKPSHGRANKPTRKAQAEAASPDEIQGEARQPAEPKKDRRRTRSKKQRPPAKKDRLVELLRRENGTTIEELMVEFGWQAHTVRGAISIAAKRLGVTAERIEQGRYRLPSA